MKDVTFFPIPFLFLSFFCAFVCLWLYMAVRLVRSSRRHSKIWREAAGKLGLPPAPSTLRGRIRDLDVEVGVEVDPSRAKSLFGEVRVRVTALKFPPAEVVGLLIPGLLDNESIGSIQSFQAINGGLSQAVVGEARSSSELVNHVDRVVAAVERVLAAPVPGLLAAELAVGNPSGLRLKSLKALVEHYPRTEETARALHACVADFDPEVRYLAARETGAAALEAFSVDDRIPPELRLEALRNLEVRVPFERLSAVIGKVLQLRGDGPLLWALELVAARRDQAHSERVCALASSSTPALAEAVATTLQALGTGSEAAMVSLMRSPSEAAQRVAIGALREWGAVRAVEPLLLLADRGALQDAARDAIRAIQSRMQGAEAGRVSLVESVSDGGISLVPEREKS